MDSIALISKTSEPTFEAMISSCSRKVRDTLYARMGIKVKPVGGVTLQLGKHKGDQVKKLHEKFKNSDSKAESDVCQEIIRNWLYTQRPMLKATLDFLKVPNQDGLVETELDFFKTLSESDTKAVFNHVSGQFPAEHVWIYLNFVEVPNVPIVN
ncbi:MAG: hypothetical protein WCK49_05630 [Myxococcaceae bacterium]